MKKLIFSLFILSFGCTMNTDNTREDSRVMYKVCTVPNGDTVYRYMDSYTYIYVVVDKDGKTKNIAVH